MTQPQSTTDDRRTGPLIQAYGEDGTLAGYVAQGVIVLNPDGSIPATAPVSDATAANQVLQITQETLTNTTLGAVTASPTANTIGDRLKTINTTLGSPFQAGGLVGVKGADGSTIAGPSNGFSVLGTKLNDGSQSSTGGTHLTMGGIDTGTNVYRPLLVDSTGRVIITDGSGTANSITVDTAQLPTTIGQKTGAASVSVVWASDATLPAGANIIGKVGIDQTTPGTTNGVAVAQIGATTVLTGNGVTGTGSQRVTIASDNTAFNIIAAGNVAHDGVDSGNPVKIGGYASTAAPSAVQVGDRVNAWMSLSGATATFITDGSTNAVTIGTTGSDGVSSGIVGLVARASGYIYNGATWDRARKPNVVKRIASSAASGNPDFLKASAGELSQFWGTCGVTAAFLQVYNKASAPTVGSDTPILTFPITAAANFTQTIPNGGLYFSTGVAFAFTTDAAGTTGSAAAAITACMLIGM